ncbi:MAG: energy-coupling factor transporter ATPase [Anaerolineae bacterium]|nr:energy-coupling factor transporter ATPase [Anaerolineae bacterium]NIN99665.1 energy-coupling factor transporter ATPase [Anaerolineae bacterium]NIQ82518.1 energy-coupling factor transporter ATPase [Anaerolineae bacterium]
MKPIIQVEDLHHTYLAGTPFEAVSLRGVDMEVGEGEIVAIIGPTGSGKSTLIQHFNGLIRPQRGKVIVAGKDLTAENLDVKGLRRQVGLVFQSPEQQLFEQYVGDDIAFGPRKYGLDATEVRQRVRKAMEIVGLGFEEFKDRLTFSLSGGEMRKVAIAGVLALEPRILIFDEPTSGLDPATSRELVSKIVELHAREGVTVILVSHNMEDVAQLADRAYAIVGGRTVMQGSPRQVFSQVELLRGHGLDVPQVTQVMYGLRSMGRDVRVDLVTVEEAEEEISRCLSLSWQEAE